MDEEIDKIGDIIYWKLIFIDLNLRIIKWEWDWTSENLNYHISLRLEGSIWVYYDDNALKVNQN